MHQSSAGPARRRNTRDRAADSPYARPERNKSLINRVTDSVKDLLTPSWLTTLVSTPKKSQNGDPKEPPRVAPVAQTAQPSHTGSDGPLLPQRTVTEPSEDLSTRRASATAPMVVQVPLSSSNTKRSSHQSAEGFGSPASMQKKTTVVQQTKPTPRTPLHSEQTQRAPQSANQGVGLSNGSAGSPSPLQPYGAKKARLLLDESSHNDSKLDRSLNVSSFAKSFSESLNQTSGGSILSAKDLSNSSFYPGKTVYGGVSSRKSFQLPAASPYKRVEPRRKSARFSESAAEKSQPISRTANLILRSLAKTGLRTSPTSVDSQEKSRRSGGMFSPAVYLRKKSSQGEKETTPKSTPDAPPKVSLQTSSVPRIVPNMFRPDLVQKSDSEVKVKSLAAPSPAAGSIGGGKLKKGREQHYSAPTESDDLPPEVPNLSTTFTLPIGSGAKFNFGMVPTVSSAATTSGSSFSFSSPVAVSKTAEPVLSPSVSPTAFAFSSPPSAQGGAAVLSVTTTKPSSLNPLAAAFVPKSGSDGKWKCDTCLIQNDEDKQQCVACSTSKPGSTAASSSSGAAVASAPVVTSGWGSMFSGSADKWSCSDCLVRNDSSHKSCVACGGKKPESGGESSSIATTSTSAAPVAILWGDAGKSSECQHFTDTWKCDACLLSNSSDKTKCVACESPKPQSKGTSAAPPSTTTPSTSGWADIFKPKDQWKCDSCLVQNDSDKDSCVACDSKRPSADKSAGAAASTLAASWGNAYKTSGGGKWKCDCCLVQNESGADTCVACQTKKPGSGVKDTNSGTPSGWSSSLFKLTASDTWKCDACLLSNSSDKTKCVACESPKPQSKGASAAPPSTTTPSTSGWADIFKPKDQWKCDACLIQNDSDKDSCVACGSKRPSADKSAGAAASTLAASWGTAYKTPSGNGEKTLDMTGTAAAGWAGTSSTTTAPWGASSDKWKCSTCLVANDPTVDQCCACSTAKPAAAAAASKPKPAAAQWKCNTCLVTNQASVSLCACCGACKPGTQSSLGDIDKGKQLPLYVKFGGPLPTSATSTESAVSVKPLPSVFGVAPTSANSTTATESGGGFKPTGGFSFGGFTKKEEPSKKSEEPKDTSKSGDKVDQSTDKVDSKPLFSALFGSASPTVSTEQKVPTTEAKQEANKPPGSNLFRFGQSSTPDSTGAAATTTSAGTVTSGMFSFGAKSATSEPTTESAKPPIPFAASSDTKAANADTPKPVFSFGSAAPPSTQTSEQAKPGFSFGATPSDKPTAPSAAGFSFGSKPSTTQAPTKPSASSTPAFNFGSTPATTSAAASEQSKPAFSFGTPSAPATTGQADSTKQAFSFVAAAGDKPAASGGFSFGAKSSTQASALPSFTFGASSGSKTTETAAPAFPFGAASSNKPSVTSTTGFAFGAKPSTTQADMPTKPASFAFGASAATAAVDSSKPTEGPKPGFSFGNLSSTKPEEPKPGFSFGAAADKSKPAFAFGSSQPAGNTSNQAATQPVFQFGSQAAASTLPADASKAPVFQFGQQPAAATSDKPVFQFGSSAAASNQPASATFQFGSAATSSASAGSVFGSAAASAAVASPFGASSGAAATPFGSASAAAPINQGIFSNPSSSVFGSSAPAGSGFQFGSGAAPSSSFNFGSAAPANPSGQAPVFQFGAANTNTGSAAFQFGSQSRSATVTPVFGAAGVAQTSDNSDSSSSFTVGSNNPPAGRQIKRATRRLKKP